MVKRVAVLVGLGVLEACVNSPNPPGEVLYACGANGACPAAYACAGDKLCHPSYVPDGGLTDDGGFACSDGGMACPAGQRCGPSGGCAAGGFDGGLDAGPDGGADGGVDGGMDGGIDAGADGGVDAGGCPFATAFRATTPIRCLPSGNMTGECDDVVLTDVNGDGMLDLVVADYADSTINVLLNTGGGSFAAPTQINAPDPTDGGCYSSASFGILSTSPAVALATFASNQLETVPLSSDGGSMQVFVLNDAGYCYGGSTWTPSQPPVVVGQGAKGRFAIVMDLLAYDSSVPQLDVVAVGASGSLSGPLALHLTTYAQDYVAADVNGDGLADVLVAEDPLDGTAGTFEVFLSLPDGGFSAAMTYGAGVGALALVVGKLNPDGFPDVAVANSGSPGTPSVEGSVSLFYGAGDGGFRRGGTLSPLLDGGWSPYAIALGDFDRDGVSDLALIVQAWGVGPNANPASEVLLLQGLPDGGFALDAPVLLSPSNQNTAWYPGIYWLRLGNLTRDGGPPDLIASYQDLGSPLSPVMDLFESQCP